VTHGSSVTKRPAGAAKRQRRSAPKRRSRRGLRKRWIVLGLPILGFAALLALAPPSPESDQQQSGTKERLGGAEAGSFRYLPDDEVYALDFDPRKVRVGLLEGWDREQDAYQDTAALAYVSGPMYERHVDNGGQEITVPLGDLKLGQRIWKGRNRTASQQRAFIGIGHDGSVDFGYGELTNERERRYDTFVGGLHSVYNDLKAPPASYKGAYSISMGQRIRYYLPRIRMVFGLRDDGRMEMLMSKDGLTLEQTRDLARRRGLVAAYMPDHASKSRLIIPGVKGFTEEDANWISGGATSFVHVPYLLRLSERRFALEGNLMANLSSRVGMAAQCDGPVDCAQWIGNRLIDRALAGLNRVMEQGVEPVARMIWSPKQPTKPGRSGDSGSQTAIRERSPLPEPPITADPLVLQELDPGSRSPEPNDPVLPGPNQDGLDRLTLPPDLPPPIVVQEKSQPSSAMQEKQSGAVNQDALVGAPPPPVLPPPLP
jgi:hypothetical protein